MSNQLATLLLAAHAVVARWDTPAWKEAPHTGEFIHLLRLALAAHEAAKPEPLTVPEGCAVVPVWPTKAMLDAGRWDEHGEDTLRMFPVDDDRVLDVWQSMIAKTPIHYRAELAAPVAVASPWMPIETAPKDGSLLLLWERFESEPFIGQWVSSAYGGKWAASRTHYDTDGNACVIDRVYSDGVTHWQPLPPAPNKEPT